ncbi:aldehyde-lyase domain-containing protein [Tanacetum coccineum]
MATLTFSPTSSLQPKTPKTPKHTLHFTHKTLTHIPNPTKFQSLTFLTKPHKTLIKSKISDILESTPNTPQTLKSRLNNGEILYGLFLLSNSPTLAEIAGLSGYDYVVVDLEHGPGGISDALACLRALAATNTPAIIRIPDPEPMWVKKALDIGPQGIMFPMIESQKMAKKAVSYCRYPPNGIRGAAHSVVRASGYGIDNGYLSNCEDELFIMCQVESEEGVKKIEEIAAVDGVDCVQMGPLDLSASMGYLWDPGNKKVKEMRTAEKGVLKTLGKGKGKDGGGGAYLGGFAMPFDTPEDMRPRGYHMISGAVDIAMFRNACVEDVKRFKSKAVSNDEDLDSIEIDKDSEEKYWSE